MKRLYTLLFLLFLLLSCGEDEPIVIPVEPSVNFGSFSYSVEDITSTSLEIKFIGGVSGTGGVLKREIWYKKTTESEWSIKDITNAEFPNFHILDGLEKGKKYNIKPVFSVGDIVKEGAERRITTLPFQYFSRGYTNERLLMWTRDSKDEIDFTALSPEPSFFLKYANDSLEMSYSVVSKDSLIVSLESNSSVFFNENEEYVEEIKAPVSFTLNEYYNEKIIELEIPNKKPKIDSLTVSQVRDCNGFKRTQLSFKGLFWDPLSSLDSYNNADDYQVKISSVQNPSISTPIMTISEFDQSSSSFNQGCKDGFRTVIDIPVQNFFHRGSILWIAFPKDLLPEGQYMLQFSAIKNNEIYIAEPFEFELSYE